MEKQRKHAADFLDKKEKKKRENKSDLEITDEVLLGEKVGRMVYLKWNQSIHLNISQMHQGQPIV